MNWTTDLIRCHQYFHEYSLLFQDPINIAFSYYCSSVTSDLRQYFGLSLHCMTLTLFNSTGQVFCRLSTICLSDVFFFFHEVMGLWIISPRGVAFSVNHIKVYMHQHGLSLVILPWSLEFARVLSCTVTIFPLLTWLVRKYSISPVTQVRGIKFCLLKGGGSVGGHLLKLSWWLINMSGEILWGYANIHFSLKFYALILAFFLCESCLYQLLLWCSNVDFSVLLILLNLLLEYFSLFV